MNGLIGKAYPVKDTEDNIVGYKTIYDARDLENSAGYTIALSEDNNASMIIISYLDACEIVCSQEKYKSFRCLVKSGAI